MKRNLTLGIALFLLAFALVFTGCPEPEKPKDVPANTSETRPQALTDGVWYDGEIVVSGNEIWFSFPVTFGKGYDLSWNDSYSGDSTKTADIYVNVKYQGAPDFLWTSDEDSAWSTPETIFPNQTGTILIKVSGYTVRNSTGTFAIRYQTYPLGGEGNAIPLTEGEWEDYTLQTRTEVVWFSFPVTAGIAYNVFWDDSYSLGSGMCTADVYVSAKYVGSSTSNVFCTTDTAFTSAAIGAYNGGKTFTPTQNSVVLLRVQSYTSYGTIPGNFAIVYTTGTGSSALPSIRMF